MDKESQGVDSIFLAAIDISSIEDRADYLNEACGDDFQLRQRVDRLLEAHPKADGSFLEVRASACVTVSAFLSNSTLASVLRIVASADAAAALSRSTVCVESAS